MGCGPIGTNLTYMPAPTNGTILSSTGTPAFVPLVNTINAGLMSPANFLRLRDDVEVLSNKQNSMLEDGTGKKYPTVDAVNLFGLNILKVTASTGFIDRVDDFTMDLIDPSTIHITASNPGAFVRSKLFIVPPITPAEAVVQIPERDYLSSEVTVPAADGRYFRFIGYNYFDDSIVNSPTSYYLLVSIVQLSYVEILRSGGVNTFTVLQLEPDLSTTALFETVMIANQTTVVVVPNPAPGLTIDSTQGLIKAHTINWGTTVGNLHIKIRAAEEPATFTIVDPGYINSAAAYPTTTSVNVLKYWNGTSLVDIPNPINNCTIQRWLLTLDGRLIQQVGDKIYASKADAEKDLPSVTFPIIFPSDIAIEICKMIAVKTATDLTDTTKVQFYYGGGGGGGSSAGATDLDSLTDVELVNPLDAQVLTYEASTQLWKNKPPAGGSGGTITGTGTAGTHTMWIGPSAVGNSSITETVSLITIGLPTTVSGSLIADSFARPGGLPTQFLKADGSVDTNTYQTTITNPVTGTGAGVVNSLAIWTSATALGSSSFTQVAGVGYFTVGASYVRFLGGGNSAIYMFRSQSNMDILLGNPQIAQYHEIIATNSTGLSIDTTGELLFKVGATHLEALKLNTSRRVIITLAPATGSASDQIVVRDTTTGELKVIAQTTGHNPVTINATPNGLTIDGSQVLSLGLASSLSTGALINTDWVIFNNKQNALGFTPVPDTRKIDTFFPLSGGGDLTADRTITIPQANSLFSGYLINTDWIIFNGKQEALSGTGVVKSTAGTITYLADTTVGDSVLTSTNPSAITFLRANANNTVSWLDAAAFRTAIGAGTSTVTPANLARVNDTNVTVTLGGTPTGSLLQAVTLTMGWTGTLADARIASAATWNAKQPGDNGLTSLAGLTYVSGTPFVKMTAADTFALDTNVYALASASVPNTRNINTFSPLQGGGPLTGDLTLSIPVAGSIFNGYLAATDWVIFNDKQNALTGPGVVKAVSGVISYLADTTVGRNVLTSTDPTAITFLRANADNTVSWLDAASFRTAIGVGAGTGTVTSVTGTGTVSGITLTGTGTTAVTLTLGGALSLALDGLSDVAVASPTDAQVLVYEQSTLLWKNKTIATGGGTVTSVALTMPSIFSVTGSPVTGAGTLATTLVSQTAKQFFAAPNGANGVPSFRLIVASDIPTLNQNTTGSAGSAAVLSPGANINGVLFTGASNITVADATKQPLDATLTALAGLTYVSGTPFVKMTAQDVFTLDTTTYLTANQSITLSGDVSGTGTTAITTAIGANKVTLAMMAQVTGIVFLGRSTSNLGDVSTLSVATSKTMLGLSGTNSGDQTISITGDVTAPGSTGVLTATLAASGVTAGTYNTVTVDAKGRVTVGSNVAIGTGTVTSVGLSLPAMFTVTGTPVTTSGTLTAVLASQTAKTFLAAPNGANGAPTFRLIVASDIPTLNQNTTGNAATADTAATATIALAATKLETPRLINGVAFDGTADISNPLDGLSDVEIITPVNGEALIYDEITFTWRNLPVATSSGTVTSVGGTGTVSGITLSGTVTTAGNLTLSGTLAVLPSNFASQTQKFVLAAPNAANGVPTFRQLVASDIPTLAPLASPTFTGTPLSTTPAALDNSTKIATTAYVVTALGSYVTIGTTQTIDGAKTINNILYFTGTASSIQFNSETTILTSTLARIARLDSMITIFGSGVSNTFGAQLSTELLTTVKRKFTFPDKDGTFAMLSDVSGGGGTVTSISFPTPGTTGTAPNTSVTGTAAVPILNLNIPLASATSVTAGLISKTDYDSFVGKQAGDSGLTSLAGLVYSQTAFVKMTAADTFTLDTNTYINFTSVITGFAAGANSTVLNSDSLEVAIEKLQGQTNNRQPLDAGLTSLAGLTYASASFVKMTGADTFTLDTTTYLTAVSLTNTFIPKWNGTALTNSLLSDNGSAVNSAGSFNLSNAGGTVSFSGTGSTASIAGAATVGSYNNVNRDIFVKGGLNQFGAVLSNASLTAVRVYTFPDKDGTVAMIADIPASTGGTVTSVGVTSPIGTTGTAPTWSVNQASPAPVITLNIPMASAASVTAGLLSKADYDNFVAKVSASVITASNGLNRNVNDIRLGGSLTVGTDINTGSVGISLTGNTSGSPFVLLNTGTGALISLGATPATTNVVHILARLQRNTSGTATDGIGGSILFEIENSSGSPATTGTVYSKLLTAAVATRQSEIGFTAFDINTENTVLALRGNGLARLPMYGSVSPPTGGGPALYTLGVDNQGYIIQGAGLAVTGSGAGAYITKWVTASTLGYARIFDNGGAGAFPSTDGVDFVANGVRVGIGGGSIGSNTVLGNQAYTNGTSSGNSNVAIGASALTKNTSGFGNVAVGYNAGSFLSGGVSENQFPSNSVYIGADTRSFGAGQSNEIVIGQGVTGSGSNTITIGTTSNVKTVLRGRMLINGAVDTNTHALQVLGTANVGLATFDMPAVTNNPAGGVPDALFISVKGHNHISNTNYTAGVGVVPQGNFAAGFYSINFGSTPDATNTISFDTQYKDTSTNNIHFRARKGANVVFSVNDAGKLYSDQLTFNRAIDVSSTDLNNLLISGFYNGNNMTNTPGASTSWFYITVITHSNTSAWTTQEASDLTPADINFPRKWMRVRANSVWGSWVEVVTQPAGVKVYEAIMTQSSTSAPTVTVYENSIGAIVWTRTGSAGSYLGTLTGAFAGFKTIVQISLGATSGIVQGYRNGADTIVVLTKNAAGTPTDTILSNASISIKHYS